MRTTARSIRAGLLATLVVTCGNALPAQVRRAAPVPPAAGGAATAAAAVSSTATVRGSVFYNDRRTDGLFDARRDKNGNPGQRCNEPDADDGTPPSCSNWPSSTSCKARACSPRRSSWLASTPTSRSSGRGSPNARSRTPRVGYYLDVRKSVAEVGAASHAEYEDKIRDLIYNNNMACSMAAPK